LFVGSIPFAATEQDLMQVFCVYGELAEVFVMRRPDGESKGSAFVRFKAVEGAQAAIQALHNNVTLPGAPRPLVVDYAEGKPEDGDNGQKRQRLD